MANSSPNEPLGIVRSTALISLSLVALAGSIAAALYRRVTAPPGSRASTTRVSKLVMDEWEADLARLNLPSRRDVEVIQRQIAELEAEIDQLMQHTSP